MGTSILQVDAFTDAPFGGNPAAVCLLDGPADEDWMQRVAAEMNLAATAFVEPRPDRYGLRWFTTRVELSLCGHGTLAAAHALWAEPDPGPDGDHIAFHTVAGTLTARREGDWIHLDFPAEIEHPEKEVPAALSKALGIEPTYVGRNRLDYLVEVESEEVLRQLQPDLPTLETVPARGVIVTARGSDRYDFVSRYFAPAIGIDEDQATGSAHCALGPYWGTRLGKEDMLAYQASPRGGVVRVRPKGDRVEIGGQAVTVLRGELT